jgi:GNAT superfamily N-acetyltransferase
VLTLKLATQQPKADNPDWLIELQAATPHGNSMIQRCTEPDVPAIIDIINDAATAYRGVIPADCWHEPYMDSSRLVAELVAGVEFHGWNEAGVLVGVMGLQNVRDVMLIRHAYVRRSHQSRGIGGALLTHLTGHIDGPLLVGTWASAEWAIRFYERHGFRLVASEEKDRLLNKYWNISPRQQQTSVVLTLSR